LSGPPNQESVSCQNIPSYQTPIILHFDDSPFPK
jgi:hypothetical protein